MNILRFHKLPDVWQMQATVLSDRSVLHGASSVVQTHVMLVHVYASVTSVFSLSTNDTKSTLMKLTRLLKRSTWVGNVVLVLQFNQHMLLSTCSSDKGAADEGC